MSNIKSINIQPLHKQFLQTRHLVLKVVEHVSLAQLNTIPEGFTIILLGIWVIYWSRNNCFVISFQS